MIRKQIKNVSLSLLGMGNMRLPIHADQPGTPIDRIKAQEIIDYAMANGINYYDTAYVYHNGESEAFLGEAMKKYPRESYFLATKFFILANPDYKAVFEEQIDRLQTDYIDFYLLHSVTEHNGQQYIDSGCIEYFLEQKQAGRIKNLGFSSHADVKTLTMVANHHKWDFAQLQINYFDWCFAATKEEYQVLTERNIPIIVMEPIRGGRLAALSPDAEEILKEAHPDWSLATWALRWVKRLPQVAVILSGMSTLDQIKENVSLFVDDKALTDEEEGIVMNAARTFRCQVQVPCTTCRYCCDGCPANIDIPEILEVYNKYKTDGSWALIDMENVKSEGKAEDCIACGACSVHCPQGIDIPVIMQELQQLIK